MNVPNFYDSWKNWFGSARYLTIATMPSIYVVVLVLTLTSSDPVCVGQQPANDPPNLQSLQVPSPPTNVETGSPQATPPIRIIEMIASRKYDLAHRASTGWVEVGGGEVPVDDPVEIEGKKIYLTLFFDVVMVDAQSKKPGWTLEWGKTKPIWETVSIVRIEQAGKISLAVELRPQNAGDDVTKYEYHDLETGTLLESSHSADAATVESMPNVSVIVEPVLMQNEIVRIAQLTNPVTKRSASLLRNLLDSAEPPQGGHPGRVVDEVSILESQSVREITNAVNAQFAASDVVLNLAGGMPMHVEFFGANLQIQNEPDKPAVSLVCDRLEMLDSLGVVRATIRSKDSNNSVKATCTAQGDGIVINCESTVAKESLAVRLASQTGAGANEKIRPHQAVRFRIDADPNKSEEITMVLERHYDTRRLEAELKTRLQASGAEPPLPQTFTPQISDGVSAPKPAPDQSAEENAWGAEVDGLQTRLSVQTENPTVGQPVLVRYEVRNTSKRVRKFDPQKSMAFRILQVTQPNGEPDLYIGGSFQTSGQDEALEPGTTRVLFEDIDVTKLYLMSEKGLYNIRCTASDVPESNSIEIQLGEGQLDSLKQVVSAIRKNFPSDNKWKISLSGDMIVITHSASNLKEDVTTIQLWFTQEELDRDFELGSGSTKQSVHRIGKHELGFANVASTSKAASIMPDYLQKIRDALDIE
jgi:hypothetical protein